MFNRPTDTTPGYLRIGNAEYPLTKDGMREAFASQLDDQAHLNEDDVHMLAMLVGEELCRRNRRIAGGRAKGARMLPSTVTVAAEGNRLTAACICVDVVVHGDTFARREAVALNRDCSLGIAEWADERDVMPFLRALDAWMDEVKDELFWQRMHADGGGRDD